jgi:hypothetical protein
MRASETRVVLAVLAVAVAGCGAQVDWNGQAAGGIVTGTGTGTGGGSGSTTGLTFDGLPCSVATVLQNNCTRCHGATLAGGAPYSLTTRADLIQLAPAPYAAQTKGQRCVARMAAATAPMPPAGTGAVAAADQAAFSDWVDAGMPAGTCGSVAPPQIVCTSGVMSSSREGQNMRPGEACQGCHQGNGEARGYSYMGTVYPTLHEQTDCDSLPPSSVVVDILDPSSGAVLQTLAPSSRSGNFLGSGVVPYKARVRNLSSGNVLTMTTAQTSGDCNSCHTELGANGAPGRIIWPN